MAEPEEAQHTTMRLRDGRVLGYAEYGNPECAAVLYVHGHPDSRLEARLLAQQAAAQGVRLVAADRPGIGLSACQPHRRMTDWPQDVADLAGHLDISRFAVLGMSAGAPYALACACAMPDRVTACGVVSGVGPLGGARALLARSTPPFVMRLTRPLFRDQARAGKALAWAARRWPEPDRQLMSDPSFADAMAASLADAVRPGIKGVAYDGMLLGRPWRFSLSDLAVPAFPQAGRP